MVTDRQTNKQTNSWNQLACESSARATRCRCRNAEAIEADHYQQHHHHGGGDHTVGIRRRIKSARCHKLDKQVVLLLMLLLLLFSGWALTLQLSIFSITTTHHWHSVLLLLFLPPSERGEEEEEEDWICQLDRDRLNHPTEPFDWSRRACTNNKYKHHWHRLLFSSHHHTDHLINYFAHCAHITVHLTCCTSTIISTCTSSTALLSSSAAQVSRCNVKYSSRLRYVFV